jgi:hypothetical protein
MGAAAPAIGAAEPALAGIPGIAGGIIAPLGGGCDGISGAPGCEGLPALGPVGLLVPVPGLIWLGPLTDGAGSMALGLSEEQPSTATSANTNTSDELPHACRTMAPPPPE